MRVCVLSGVATVPIRCVQKPECQHAGILSRGDGKRAFGYSGDPRSPNAGMRASTEHCPKAGIRLLQDGVVTMPALPNSGFPDHFALSRSSGVPECWYSVVVTPPTTGRQVCPNAGISIRSCGTRDLRSDRRRRSRREDGYACLRALRRPVMRRARRHECRHAGILIQGGGR